MAPIGILIRDIVTYLYIMYGSMLAIFPIKRAVQPVRKWVSGEAAFSQRASNGRTQGMYYEIVEKHILGTKCLKVFHKGRYKKDINER